MISPATSIVAIGLLFVVVGLGARFQFPKEHRFSKIGRSISYWTVVPGILQIFCGGFCLLAISVAFGAPYAGSSGQSTLGLVNGIGVILAAPIIPIYYALTVFVAQIDIQRYYIAISTILSVLNSYLWFLAFVLLRFRAKHVFKAN